MKNKTTHKLALGLIACFSIDSLMFIMGCDEFGMKTGGGGLPQSYHLENGRY